MAIQVTEAQFDSAALRRAFGSFPTGVTVVTTLDADGPPRGMTANAFASVSLEPALLLVCIGHGVASFPAFAQCRSFAVNVLRDDQQDVSALFASRSALKFAGIGHAARASGAPVLDDCLAWLHGASARRRRRSHGAVRPGAAIRRRPRRAARLQPRALCRSPAALTQHTRGQQ